MGKTPAEADRYLVPGLARGLAVLALFTPEAPRLTQGEIARALGVTRSAIFRVVHTLVELGFLLHDPAGGRYAPGPALLGLAQDALPARDALAVARPVLERLRDATGWSAHLGVLEGAAVVYLLRAPARHGLPGIVHVGSRLPAQATAMGRVLLAQREEASLPPPLIRRARADRARGHVVHLGEFEAGMASIAAPLRDETGRVVAAISLARRLAEAPEASRGAALRAVLQAAAEISARLGWRLAKPGALG